MKRMQEKDIPSFFSKCVRRDNGDNSSPNVLRTEQSQAHSSTSNNIPQSDEHETEMGTSNSTPQPPVSQVRLTDFDMLELPQDPGKRRKMSEFHPDDRDVVRSEYCSRKLCQPENHEFPFTSFGKKNRRFNPKWFDKYRAWLEYSVEKDAAFCFPCYLFKSDEMGKGAFVTDGFRNWSKPGSLEQHVGAHMSAHHKAMRSLDDFKNQKGSILSGFLKQDEEVTSKYKKRLEASVKCLKWLILQELSSHGHDENQSSYNRGNFIELLKFHEEGRLDVESVLENAPGNCQMIDPSIQKDIIKACAKETTKAIISEIGNDCFAILVDESADISDKEQLVICLRYVNKSGAVMERFLGIVHVPDTTSVTLKNAIESLLMEHSLTFSKVRGQGYDGVRNMQGSIGAIKTLIMDECPSAYYVHCFAHPLQLTLVSVAKKNEDCRWFFDEVLPLLLNFVGGSPKRKEFLCKKQKDYVVEALSTGDLESGSSLNQELSLGRLGDTCWGSHFKTIKNVLGLFRPILESLDAIAEAHQSDKVKACSIIGMLMSFDFVFVAHLMGSIFGITDALNLALQKKDQDIVIAMALVDVTRRDLQKLRDDGWDNHLKKVISFLDGYDIDLPNMEDFYVSPGSRRRLVRGKTPRVTNLHHFRVEVFLGVIDLQLQEIENRFGEKSKELLICMSCFNPTNGFSSFSVTKLVQLAGYYPNEFSREDLMFFEHSLESFVDDLRNDERFFDLKNLNELSMKLVETGKHETHSDVYLLLKLVLLLPVATASVERVFSGMNVIKNRVRNSMGDELMNDCLVTFLERDLFLNVSPDVIVERFQNMRTRREQL